MGKIERIAKSRKDYVCSSCRQVIPKGSPYLKGLLRYSPTIIRCTKCGLKWYEVTTSDYIRDVGRIVEDWEEDFTVENGVWDEIASVLEEIMDGCNERLSNMADQLQETGTGLILQERIESLEAAIDDLQSCSMEDFLREGYEALSEEEQERLAEGGDTDNFEDWYEDYWKKETELAEKWQEATEEAICNAISVILEEVPVE